MKNKKGFTLIELLGVIALLVVISLIVYPVITNVIKNNKQRVYNKQISELKRVFHTYVLDNPVGYGEGTLAFEVLISQGYIDNSQVIDPRTNEELEGCLGYKWLTSQKKYEVTYLETCEITDSGYTDAIVITFESDPSFSNANGWHKEDIPVTVNLDGAAKFTWCTTTTGSCNPLNEQTGSSGIVTITTESDKNQICVIGYDDEGRRSYPHCSSEYKLDKTDPYFYGNTGDLQGIALNTTIDETYLKNGITVFDSLSGVESSTSYTVTIVDTTATGTLDTTTTGTKEVVYSVTDKAGNEFEFTRRVHIYNNNVPPTINFATTISPKENGWYTEDLYVNINVEDKSGTGIKSTKYCVTTEGNCEPTTTSSGSASISTNGINVRVCAIAEDNNGNNSGVVCSSSYNVDKNFPIINAKKSSYTIAKGSTANLVDMYFTISNNGYAPIESTVCKTSSGVVITSTSQLSEGTHTITCTTKKENGLSKSDSLQIIYKQIIKDNKCQLANRELVLGEFEVYGETTKLSMDEIVEQKSRWIVDGLYEDASNSCRFVGYDPNNYFSIGGSSWRILSVEEQGIKLINLEYLGKNYRLFDNGFSVYANLDNYCHNQLEDLDYEWCENSRYNNDNTYCKLTPYNGVARNSNGIINGCNIWSKASEINQGGTTSNEIAYSYNGTTYRGTVSENSTLYEKLHTYYADNLSEIEEYIVQDALWGVGPVSSSSNYSNVSRVLEKEKDWTWSGKIGLISYSDYLMAQMGCMKVTNTGILGYQYTTWDPLGYGVSTEVCGTEEGANIESDEYDNPSTSILHTNYLKASSTKEYSYYTMNPLEGTTTKLIIINNTGVYDYAYYGDSSTDYYTPNPQPVIYLKHDVQLTGSGTKSDPYCILNSETTDILNDCY